MARGPFLIDGTLPTCASIPLSTWRSATGGKFVSTWNKGVVNGRRLGQDACRHTKQAPLTKLGWSVTYIGAVSYRKLVSMIATSASF